jgi:hypothetical protein
MKATGSILLSALSAIAVALQAAAYAQSKPILDYGFYKSRVEPIFLEKRTATHAASSATRVPTTTSTSRSSDPARTPRRNFEMVAKLVNPGDPESSLLTQHPLAPEAGGHAFHSGGRQFESRNDEDWKTLAAFVNGAKAP